MTAAIAAAVALFAGGPPASNQVVLTPRQSQRLVAWSLALRSCLVKNGIEVGKPDVTRKQITLAVVGAGSDGAVARLTIRCGESLGNPPSSSSLQTFPGRLVLYVPKQCLLDDKVAAASRAR